MTWEQLAAATLARQFAEGRPPVTDVAGVAGLLGRTGPVQAQTARSPFLGLAARARGVTLDLVTAAYEEGAVVRGSSLRGTVHTSTSGDHVLLDVATRLGQRTRFERELQLDAAPVERVWEATEAFARDAWRTADELLEHLGSWLAEHDPGARPRLGTTASPSLGYGHGGLVRRPLSGGWEGQGRPGYRAARAVLGDGHLRDVALADPQGSLVALVRRHLTCSGPASRRDLAWWSGVGLRAVDAALAAVPDLVTTTAPDGQQVHDLPGLPTGEGSSPAEVVPGVRLLPEFDALMCAYEPAARVRFVDLEHHGVLAGRANGLLLAPLLVDGRITGHWRAEGSGPRRRCVVTWFAGTRRPTRAEVEEQLERVATAYPLTWTGLEIVRG